MALQAGHSLLALGYAYRQVSQVLIHLIQWKGPEFSGLFLFLGMDSFFIENLRKALTLPLPGSQSHLKMIPPGRQLEPPPDLLTKVKQSAVLIILYFADGDLTCLLIKRPQTMKNHPGQVAFPGGMADRTDRSLMDTALREAQEEIGIQPESVEVAGQLSKIHVSVSNFVIHPFVVWSESEPFVRLNTEEAEKVLRFPVGKYLTHGPVQSKLIQTTTGSLNVPCFVFDDEIIWGATAMILSELMDVLKSLPGLEP